MEVRRLIGPADFDRCIQIIKNKKKMGGTEMYDLEFFIDNYDKYFIENILSDRYHAYGCIDSGEIISFAIIGYLQNKARGRFWVMPGIFTDRTNNYFTFNRPEIGLLIKTAFEYAEANEYYEYYYTIAKHVSDVYEKQINKTTYIPLHRYDRITLDIVPANTIPKVDMYFRLLGGSSKPHDMVVKKRILREEYRINKIKA